MSRALKGVLIFTAVEVVTLIAWLVLAGVPFGQKLIAAIVLAVGLFGEHYVSVNVGNGRPPFGPRPRVASGRCCSSAHPARYRP